MKRPPNSPRDPSGPESELSGYLELGMLDEALALARAFLAKKAPVAPKFIEALDAVLVADKLRPWKQPVEKAYARLSLADRRLVRSQMLSLYWSLHDYETAAKFIALRQCCPAEELFFAMETFLELERMQDAQAVARKCRRALSSCRSELDAGFLLYALADFHARTRDWSRAVKLWSRVPLTSPLLRDALLGIAEVQAAQALLSARSGLAAVAAKKREQDTSIEIQMPGLEKELTQEIENDLVALQRKLERIVPARRQRELGMERGA